MSILLDLYNALEATLESRLEIDAAGSTPLVSPPAVGKREEEAIQTVSPTLGGAQATDILSREQRNGASHPSVLRGPAARDNRTSCRCRESLSSCCATSAHSGFWKDFRISGDVGESNSKEPVFFWFSRLKQP